MYYQSRDLNKTPTLTAYLIRKQLHPTLAMLAPIRTLQSMLRFLRTSSLMSCGPSALTRMPCQAPHASQVSPLTLPHMLERGSSLLVLDCGSYKQYDVFKEVACTP